jgi:GR25 family glycosyltransferase involved in LPS biosynthesis
MWYIITINNKNDKRITRMLRNINVENFEILRYKSANKTKNVNKNNSLYELISHNSWDETSENIFQNHLLTIEKGIRENRRNIVILEDDAIINTTTSKLYRLAN